MCVPSPSPVIILTWQKLIFVVFSIVYHIKKGVRLEENIPAQQCEEKKNLWFFIANEHKSWKKHLKQKEEKRKKKACGVTTPLPLQKVLSPVHAQCETRYSLINSPWEKMKGCLSLLNLSEYCATGKVRARNISKSLSFPVRLTSSAWEWRQAGR